ncbi:PI-PLC X domain-containing protein 3 [Anoplophora glabripennis]|uniref:PI-PLC X domain-containing protein 3 n=1 Tax=Anoplophora glabripennis TaxID=217634 RepID=UPI000874DFD0|nr:PI-PLC X domain-containing protein 3 [Anoplophora glabripennis]
MAKQSDWKSSFVKNLKLDLRTKEKARLSDDLEYWMTNLPDQIKSLPIIYLAIPGSHDSFTASLSAKSEIAPDADDTLKKLKFLGPILTYFMANWSRTQAYSATEQLIAGIRYFDLRVATKEGTEDFFFVHGLYSDNVQTVLTEMLKFLESHPREVIIIDFQHFYALTDSDHDRLMQMLSKTFGAKLLPYSDHMDFISLDYMTTQYQYQVIAVYRSDAARSGQPLLWPSASFPTPWPDTVSMDDLFTTLDEGIKTRSSAVGFVSQCILTPSVSFIIKNLCNTLKKTCAEDLEVRKLQWINNQKSGEGGMNIVISDFIDLSDCEFVKVVINLNEQFLSDAIKPSDFVIDIEKNIY